ncbi:MAG: DUF433 domain-containing protein [Candidatus Sericytochromatia bacterium]|nr:DUF433 domain-containing protein [Candidatus Sericytochromatia bacterium]
MRKIVSYPDILNGKPHFVGTHVTISSLIGRLAKGFSIKEISHQLPQLSEDDVITAIKFAEELTTHPLTPKNE